MNSSVKNLCEEYKDIGFGEQDQKQNEKKITKVDKEKEETKTDRYDSCESSDSGVAALSSTEYCTSSSGTSDITDPGSPYSSLNVQSPLSCSSESEGVVADEKKPVSPTLEWSSHPTESMVRAEDIAGGGGGKDTANNNNNNHGCYIQIPSPLLHFTNATSTPFRVPQPWHSDSVKAPALLKRPGDNWSAFSKPAKALKIDPNQGKCPSPLAGMPASPILFMCHKPTRLNLDKPQGKITEYFRNQGKHISCQKKNKLTNRCETTTKKDNTDKYTNCKKSERKNGFVIPTSISSSTQKTQPKMCSTSTATKKSCYVSMTPVDFEELLPCNVIASKDEGSKDQLLPPPPPPPAPLPRFSRPIQQNKNRIDDTCKWKGCEVIDTNILEHIQSVHVNTQIEGENFVCLWEGCKVYARGSCSRSWLERHVLTHGGNRPFKCIVDGCGLRFGSQVLLERHVNSHFDQTVSSGTGSGTKRVVDTTPNKLIRRNGKKVKYRRRPWTARMFDFFDTGVMEKLQHKVIGLAQQEIMGNITPSGTSVDFEGKVVARRTEPDGKIKLLVHWKPENIVPDEWVFDSPSSLKRTVSLSALPSDILPSLQSLITSHKRNKRKQTRKPL